MQLSKPRSPKGAQALADLQAECRERDLACARWIAERRWSAAKVADLAKTVTDDDGGFKAPPETMDELLELPVRERCDMLSFPYYRINF